MRIPRIQYGVGDINLDLEYPPGRWREGKMTVGGFSESATGVRESYVVRRDRELEIPLRWPETKHEEMLTFIEAMEDNAGAAFTFYPDVADLDEEFDCVLVSPEPGERWRPDFYAFDGVFEYTFVFRRTNGEAFNLLRFP